MQTQNKSNNICNMWRTFQKQHKISDIIINCIENEFKFNNITKVQNIVIPYFIKNKDVIVKSCTGSGKTLSYLIPVFQKLINFISSPDEVYNDKILAVTTPPRSELRIQVFSVFLKFMPFFADKFPLTYALFIGGKKLSHDLDRLSTGVPNIIIATPGRLFELEEKTKLSFRDLQILILDEADKMLELGYERKVNNLIEKLPKQRRTGLFSATMNSQIENLIKVGMRNPVFIDIKINEDAVGNTHTDTDTHNDTDKKDGKGKTPNTPNATTIEQVFINEKDITQAQTNNTNTYFKVIDFESSKDLLDKQDEISKFIQETPIQLKQYYHIFENIKHKFSLMIDLINNRTEDKKMMIFFATCNAVDFFSIILPKLFTHISGGGTPPPFFKLHSKISQKKRKKEYKQFLSAKGGVLLTTDLSARGIDVPNVDLILQYDPPKNEELYIHRVGRTARVGSEGMSILFLAQNEEPFMKYMSNKNVGIFPFKTTIDQTQAELFFSILKDINKSDKWIYEKAVKGFVAYMRFYTEHDLKYIFDIKLLDIGNIANSFGLFRLPRIREIIGKKVDNFIQDETVKPGDFEYMDSNIAKQMEAKEE